jgi:hypothetical protein
VARPERKKKTIKARPQVDHLDERVVPTVGVFTGVTPPAGLISTQPTPSPAQTAYQSFLQRRQDVFASRQAALGGRVSAQPRPLAPTPTPSRPTPTSPFRPFNPPTTLTPNTPNPRAGLAFGDPNNTPGNPFAYSGPSLLGNTSLGNRLRYFSGRSLLNNTGLGNQARFFSGPSPLNNTGLGNQRFFSGANVPGVNVRSFPTTTATFRAPTTNPSTLLTFSQARSAAPVTSSTPQSVPGAAPEVTPPDVKNGPLAKAGQQLATLYSTFSQTGQVDPTLSSIMRIQGDTVGIMVRGLGDPSALAASLADQGLVASGSTTAGQVAVVEGFIPISRLPELAARADVIGIDPSLMPITY